ncbi:MAG: glycoside hydrolase family 2 TIM barrel-domain containing protein [Prolixibacteraceae bacterium]
MNNELIPDLYHCGADFYTFCFLNQFTVKEISEGEKIWLNFRGVNYKADFFFNGRRINNTTHEGMFLRKSFEITPWIRNDKANVLAVIVYPPTHPGNPNGGQSGDGTIGHDNTMQYMPGYDWCRPIRDRNTGIWDEVSITTTRSVRVKNPYVVTRVPGIRQVEGPQKDAYIKTTVELENTSNEMQSGSLIIETNGQKITRKVIIPANRTIEVAFNDLIIKNPRLWWPNGIGSQDLYNMKISFEINGSTSDLHELRYGIREISSEISSQNKGRQFYVNGQKIYITGGNYISSDWLLRLSPERYRAEIRFHADMNLRLIRVWGGAMIERPEFYDACDELGILVFQDLWGTADVIGAWDDPMKLESRVRRREYPDNQTIYLESAMDQIKMVRNHPSLCFWCGANEAPLSDYLNEILTNQIFPRLDPNRLFISHSTNPLLNGGGFDGPHDIQEPEWFFSKHIPFNPEMGSVGSPEIETLREIMADGDLVKFPVKGLSRNYVWSYHLNLGYANQLERYGEIKDIETYVKLTQVVNYEQYRSLMEGRAAKMWNWYTGIILWKTQNPWTALRGQAYDWFLDVNAVFYGIKKGSEPLHPIYNLVSKRIELINSSLNSYKGLTVKAQLYDLKGEIVWETDGKSDALANTVNVMYEIPKPIGVDGVYFLKLTLLNKLVQVTDNIYWLTTKDKDYSQLNELPATEPEFSLLLNKEGDHYSYTLKLEASGNISFFNRIKVFDKQTGKRVLPVHYSDNYVTLMPGDKKIIKFEFSSRIDQQNVSVVVDSWTSDRIEL